MDKDLVLSGILSEASLSQLCPLDSVANDDSRNVALTSFNVPFSSNSVDVRTLRSISEGSGMLIKGSL